VSDEKTNVSKPLLTHRNRRMTASKPGAGGTSGTTARPTGASSTRKLTACSPG